MQLQQSRLPGGRKLSSWCKNKVWVLNPKCISRRGEKSFEHIHEKKNKFLTAWALILSYQYFACAFGKYFYSVAEDAQNCNLFSKRFRGCYKRSQEGNQVYLRLLFSEKITLEGDFFFTLSHRIFWVLFQKCSESFSVQSPLPEMLPSILEEVCCFQNNLLLALSVLARPRVTP